MLYYLYCSLHTKWVWVLYQNYRLRINFPLLTWKITAKFSYSQLTKINISPLQYHVVNAPTFVELFKIKIHSLERECKHLDSANFNPIHDGHFRGCSMMGGGKKAPPSLKSVTHTLQWWNLAQLYLTQRRSKKYMNHVTHPLSSADISIFSPEISKFCYIKKYRYRLHFNT